MALKLMNCSFNVMLYYETLNNFQLSGAKLRGEIYTTAQFDPD